MTWTVNTGCIKQIFTDDKGELHLLALFYVSYFLRVFWSLFAYPESI